MPHSHGAGVRERAQCDASGHPTELRCLWPPRQDARQGTEVRRPPRRHLGFQARLHQAEGCAIGQVGMPHDVRLRQRLGYERLERRIHN